MVWDFCFYVLPLNLLNLNVAAGSPVYIVLIYQFSRDFQIFLSSKINLELSFIILIFTERVEQKNIVIWKNK